MQRGSSGKGSWRLGNGRKLFFFFLAESRMYHVKVDTRVRNGVGLCELLTVLHKLLLPIA